jgi:hypothetical protein
MLEKDPSISGHFMDFVATEFLFLVITAFANYTTTQRLGQVEEVESKGL